MAAGQREYLDTGHQHHAHFLWASPLYLLALARFVHSLHSLLFILRVRLFGFFVLVFWLKKPKDQLNGLFFQVAFSEAAAFS